MVAGNSQLSALVILSSVLVQLKVTCSAARQVLLSEQCSVGIIVVFPVYYHCHAVFVIVCRRQGCQSPSDTCSHICWKYTNYFSGLKCYNAHTISQQHLQQLLITSMSSVYVLLCTISRTLFLDFANFELFDGLCCSASFYHISLLIYTVLC